MDYLSYWQKGIHYAEYLKNFEEEVAAGPTDVNKNTFDYIKLNWSRTSRLEKKTEVDFSAFPKPTKKLKAICLTEHWCGDAAQNLPIIIRICEAVGIEMKILYRDANLELMDAFLTNGARSIPKVIVFDDSNELAFDWGPRPEVAQSMLKDYKSGQITKEEFNKKVQLWYNQDKGETLSSEWSELLRSV